MSLRMVVLLAGCCLLISSGFAFGQGRSASLPGVAVPAKLEPYADVQLVSKNARRAIGLLATAQTRLNPYPEPIPNQTPGAAPWPKQIGPECDTEDVRSFNRGYLLAHTGFNLFLSLQELGVPQVEGPHGGPDERRRHFIQFGRSALLSVWTPNRLRDLLKVREALRDMPTPIKQDLSAFLSKLAEYRQHYDRLKKARAAVLDDLFRREDHAYVWYEAWVGAGAKERSPRTGIGESKLTELLDGQIRQVSDLAKADPGGCFVSHYGPIITLPSEKLEYANTWIYPTKYLVSFWRRRDMEGTSALADYVIAQVLETLRGA